MAEARAPTTFGAARDENGNLTLACDRCPNGSLTFPNVKTTVMRGSVVRFLIEDLGVQPRRPDWQAVLDRHADIRVPW